MEISSQYQLPSHLANLMSVGGAKAGDEADSTAQAGVKRKRAAGSDAALMSAVVANKGGGESHATGKPAVEINAPKGTGASTAAVMAGLGRLRDNPSPIFNDPAQAAAYDTTYQVFSSDAQPDQAVSKQAADAVDGGDAGPSLIGGKSSSMMLVLLAATEALNDSVTASTAMQTQMTQLSFDATNNAARDIKQQGQDQLNGAISNGVMSCTGEAVGAAMNFKSLNVKSTSIKVNLEKASDIETSESAARNEVYARSTLHVEEETTQFEGNDSQGNRKTVNVKGDKKELDEEALKLAANGNAQADGLVASLRRKHDLEVIRATKYETTAGVVKNGGKVTGELANGAANLQRSNDQAAQTVSESASKAEETTANQVHDSKEKDEKLRDQLISLVSQMNEGRSQTMSAIAQNIRA